MAFFITGRIASGLNKFLRFIKFIKFIRIMLIASLNISRFIY